MAEEVISHVDFVIDADGFRKTGELLGTMDKYMERVQRRAQTLSKMKIVPVIRLSDCLCTPLKQIRAKLDMLTKTDWSIAIMARFSIESAVVEQTIEKLRKIIGELTLRMNVELSATLTTTVAASAAGSGSGTEPEGEGKGGGVGAWFKDVLNSWAKDKAKKALDFGAEKLFDKMLGMMKGGGPLKTAMTFLRNAAFGEKKSGSAADCCCGGGPGSVGAAASRSRGKNTKSNRERSQTKKSPALSGPEKTKAPGRLSKMFSGAKGLAGKAVLAPVLLASKAARSIAKTPVFQTAKSVVQKVASSKAATSVMKFGGKLFRPLSIASDAISIATAKPGQARNKAIGGALGGWGGAAAGAAIGSMMMPVVGTLIGGAIGGLAGSSAGEAIGKNVVGAAKAAGNFGKKVWGSISGNHKSNAAPPLPQRPASIPVPTVSSAVTQATLQQTSSVSLSVNIPVGAVQLKVEDKLNYDELSAIIGSKIVGSIRQAMENRP